MWTDHVAILRCPKSGQSLHVAGGGAVASADGRYAYPVKDDVFHLLPEDAVAGSIQPVQSGSSPGSDVKTIVQNFYDEIGWKLADNGKYRDTSAFVDNRPLSYRFTDNCMRRMGNYLPPSGRYLLDAGCGAIPHEAYLGYQSGFKYRVCVDFSKQALDEAKKKLGPRGVYVLGDVTNLPIASDAVDAVTCNHVLYHISPEQQAVGFKEIWRVLKPGGRAVVVYAWSYSPLANRLTKLASALMPLEMPSPEGGASLPFFPQSLEWFISQPWPFSYRIRSFRAVGNGFLRRYIGDDWRSRVLLSALWCLQNLVPGFAGRYGQHPAILISK